MKYTIDKAERWRSCTNDMTDIGRSTSVIKGMFM